MANSYCSENHILVGLGGTGGKILKAFKMRMFEEFPDAKDRDKQPVALLYVDSTREMMGIGRPDFRVMGLDASFEENEFLNIKDVDIEHILNHIDNYPAIKGIINNVSAVKTAIGSLGQAAGQKRRAGRILFAANAVAYVNALRNAYSKCVNISQNANELNIHIFAGLCGGTGSGAIVDAIVQARKTFPDANIAVYAMIPEMNLPHANMDQGRYYQNGYAALNELNGLQAGRFIPHDVTGAGREAKLFTDRKKGVADGLTLYSNVNENGLTINSLTELPKIVSDYVYARVFLINSNDTVNHDIIRAYTFENMDDFALEYDETQNIGANGQIPVARTKKVNSFGIKRVIYPELRVLKHITYTIGEKILFQFKYNNWNDNQGYINEEPNKDYRQEYFNDANLAKWMLDDKHLTLESKILPSDRDYPAFYDYWHDKAIDYAGEAKMADNPLNELDNILADFYAKQFRKKGVDAFFKDKEQAVPEMAKEVRSVIEHELYEKWKTGDISIVELIKISSLLLERISNIRKDIDAKLIQLQTDYDNLSQERQASVNEWVNKGFLAKKVFGGDKDSFAAHQEILTDYYTCKTRLEAYAFAKKLCAKLFIELGKLDADISLFGQKITDAIDETERLVAAQRKVNKGLEDMKGAVIEVSEEETMSEFEVELKVDKVDMPNIARQIREAILPESEFVNFGLLAESITIEEITDAFDLKLAEVIKIKHDEKIEQNKKVLGLNILTQLKQKLTTDEEIQRFALDIVKQSGVYLKLNNDQMQLHVRNNEGNLSPTNPASINKKVILVSIPSPDENEQLKHFADKLEKAFRNSFAQGNQQTTLVINKKSLRKDELSITTVAYCFPIRAISWMEPYRDRYESFLNTGNVNTDASNAILLHTEGDGKQLPSLFVVENAAEIAAQTGPTGPTAPTPQPMGGSPMGGTVAGPGMPPPPPGAGPGMPPPPQPVPQIQLMMFVGGQQYGPFDYATCKQMVQTGQLNQQTTVWMQGMPAWTPAGQVPELQTLFAPQMTPPMPPTPGGMTPPPMPPMGGGMMPPQM